MARLIDANALKNAMYSIKPIPDSEYIFIDVIIEGIDNSPTVEAEPVVHGRWERCGGDLHSSGYAIYCSVCNKTHFVHYKHSLGGLYGCKELFEKPKYCPSCGAFMEVEE